MPVVVRVGLATAALLLIGGCRADGEKPASEGNLESVPDKTTAAPKQTTYNLGDTVDFSDADGAEFNVTIEDYKRKIPDDGSVESGRRLDALLIRACNVSFEDDPNDSDLGTIINPFNFKLVDDDDGEYKMLDLTPSPAPQPQLDTFAVIGKGECKKGWLAFAVPDEVRLPTVTYAVDTGEVLAVWHL